MCPAQYRTGQGRILFYLFSIIIHFISSHLISFISRRNGWVIKIGSSGKRCGWYFGTLLPEWGERGKGGEGVKVAFSAVPSLGTYILHTILHTHTSHTIRAGQRSSHFPSMSMLSEGSSGPAFQEQLAVPWVRSLTPARGGKCHTYRWSG